jgi:endonuclease YncB( thermonuclease family)
VTLLPPVPAPFYFNAWVDEWTDGDTGLFRVDRGDRDYSSWSVRLLGSAARELADPGGPDALAWLNGHLPPGSVVVLATVKPDKYGGRKLARVFYEALPGVTVDLTAVMIREGWAAPWNGRGPQPKPPWPRRETPGAPH